MKVKRIGIISRRDRASLKLSEQIYWYLKDCVKVTVSRELSHLVGEKIKFRLADSDLLVVVGGDGTILRTLHLLDEPVPILGVNTGDIGFLTEIGGNYWEKALRKILRGDFTIEKHTRIEVMVDDVTFPASMNEVVIVTAKPAKMLSFNIRVNGEMLDHFRADGIIFATPTGSTAYAMSSGGPIVEPSMDSIIMVPMAPFKLSARPWVLPGNSKIEFTMEKRSREAIIAVDGQVSRKIYPNQKVIVGKSDSPALFVNLGMSFYEKMRSKIRKIY
jgi:NAD+ kinase